MPQNGTIMDQLVRITDEQRKILRAIGLLKGHYVAVNHWCQRLTAQVKSNGPGAIWDSTIDCQRQNTFFSPTFVLNLLHFLYNFAANLNSYKLL